LALDNEEARNFSNRMCYQLGIPLVDAGTNGFKATSGAYVKHAGPCYECLARKGAEETFPACTIRQKPDKMIHCIVWAKALYEGLFGPQEQSSINDLNDLVEGFQA